MGNRAIKLPRFIGVDGVQRPVANSAGRLIHPTEEGIRNFWRWFGDSRVVDEQGRPLVVYHGTASEFSSFDLEKVGGTFGYDKVGFFFTDDCSDIPGGAGDFAARAARYSEDESGANIIPAYLSLQNPYTLDHCASDFNVDIESLVMYAGEQRALIDVFDQDRDEIMRLTIDGGHDGLDFRFGGDSLLVAIHPEQIKSAIGNRGTFDPSDVRLTDGAEGLAGARDTAVEPRPRRQRYALRCA